MSEQKDEPKWVLAQQALQERAKQSERVYTVTTTRDALGKITGITSGSYNAAVDLKNDVVGLVIGLDDLRASVIELKSSAAPQQQVGHLETVVQQLTQNYARLEGKANDQVTLLKKTAEQVQRFADFMEERLDMFAAVEAAKSHDSRISDLESWRKQHSSEHAESASLSQSKRGNRIAWLALIVSTLVLIITALDKLGWIAYWSR